MFTHLFHQKKKIKSDKNYSKKTHHIWIFNLGTVSKNTTRLFLNKKSLFQVSTLDCGIDPAGALRHFLRQQFHKKTVKRRVPVKDCNQVSISHKYHFHIIKLEYNHFWSFLSSFCLLSRCRKQTSWFFIGPPKKTYVHPPMLRRCVTNSRVASWGAMAVFTVSLCDPASPQIAEKRVNLPVVWGEQRMWWRLSPLQHLVESREL